MLKRLWYGAFHTKTACRPASKRKLAEDASSAAIWHSGDAASVGRETDGVAALGRIDVVVANAGIYPMECMD